jgi:hypothetical protein
MRILLAFPFMQLRIAAAVPYRVNFEAPLLGLFCGRLQFSAFGEPT